MKKALALAFVAGLVTSSNALAELKVGDAAPKLSIKDWVKGKPFDLSKAKSNEVVVVEFWATWCPPCRASIPHMSEMQDHFKDKGVTFIGVTDEDKKTVEKFLKNGFDDKMRYRVAIDNDDKTHKAWMQAAGQQGIPTAFVVMDGKLKWIGHPMNDLDLTVAKLVGDTEYVKKQEKLKELMNKFQMAAMAEDWKKAVDAVDEALKVDGSDFRLLMTKYHLLVTKLKKQDDAAKVGREILEKTNDPEDLNALSWTILTSEDFDGVRDLPLAKKAAEKAMKASHDKDPSIIDTYARALADTGDLKGAVEWETKAVDLAPDGSMKDQLKNNLEDFKKRLQEKA